MSRADLEVVAEVAARHDCWILSDEIYARMVYEGEHYSVAALPGMQARTVILDCFSKTYAMTGWRLGYGVMPVELAQGVTRLMINSNSCTAACTQVADALLDEAGVATLAGTCFGAYGKGYLRMSYATSLENIEKALERMKKTLRVFGNP
jgi:aspartate/methionine/tyrosine aminotransferase